ncbi:coiled-coil domain-containing protein 34-like [Anopheles ziemanni]|uniref:coiled-coil domain-containing protein 34-like n=1 Tax=Anopheles coustani TaxID=139045 RepID=UPI002659877A|nr:coiled-coil domain-containing protein 34-like [Anopheles coustani]XP_058178838.1 coiled-coil domain-containing protein 34-like [Anopheles ziemanni]
MEADIAELGSNLSDLSIQNQLSDTDCGSDISGGDLDEIFNTSESSEEDEYVTDGSNNCQVNSNIVGKNNSGSTENSSNGYDSDKKEGSSECSDETLTTSIDEEEDVPEVDSKVESTDRGGGDADLHFNYDVVTVADEGTSCGTIKVKILTRKRQHDPEAYQKWILAKNEEIRQKREMEKLRAQEVEEQRRREEEKRMEINNAKVQQWMQRKKQNASQGTKPTSLQATTPSCTEQFIQNNADVRFKTWLKRVKQQEEEKRAKEIMQEQLQKHARDYKKKVSEEIYKEWLKSSKNKPRPVPLNQGPHTLRGTVSKIFVNPQPWKSPCDEGSN